MSYEISLYERAFLKRALEFKLGDWTNADPIAPEALDSLVLRCEAAGFVAMPVDEAFVAFMKDEGATYGREYELSGPSLLSQLSVFPGHIAFSIPYSPHATASIAFCRELAKAIALEFSLAYYDPQTGDVQYA